MLKRRPLLPLVALLCSTLTAVAQTPPPMAAPPVIDPDQKMFVITYIDVAPTKVKQATAVIAAYKAAAARAQGLTRFDALQRIGIANQFALIQNWGANKLEESHEASTVYKKFRSTIGPLMIAAYDERKHIDLNSGEIGKVGANAIFVATHVDIIPTLKDKGVAAVKVLADKSRGTTGNLRFDALTQYSRQNHMTLVEIWRTRGDQEKHAMAADTTSFRQALSTMSGSLFDERLYRPVVAPAKEAASFQSRR
jgi:quinol monooxygenase YgiN